MSDPITRSGSNYSAPRDSNRVPTLLGVLNTDGATPTPLEVNSSGQLLVTGSGGSGGGTSSTFNATFPTTGTAIGASNGTTMSPLLVDGSGYLEVNVKAGSGSGLSVTDEASWTAGTSQFIPNGGVFNDSATTLTSGQQGTQRFTTNRGAHINIRNSAGTEIATSSNPLQVSLANTASNATAVKIDGSAIIQPISGTITANAGTNLNTSTLALESGGNLATIAGAVTSSIVQENVKQINGVTPLMGNGISGTGSQRVNIASDNTAFSVNANAGTNLNTSALALETGGNLAILAGAVTTSVIQANTKQINGVAPTMGNGVSGTGVQRVTIASDSTGQLTLATGTTTAVTQATASSLNATVVGTGTFAVQATESGTWTVGSNSATGSAVPSNAFYEGLIAQTTNPSAATAGNLVGALSDKLGKQVVVGSIRNLKGDATITLTASTSETTLIAQVASTFIDIYGVIIENTSGTATEVAFRDTTGGTIRFNIYIPAGDTRGFMLPESGAWTQTTVNTNWTAQCTTSVSSIKIAAMYVKNI